MTRRWTLCAAAPAAAAGIAIATLGVAAGSSAGKPVALDALLCGTWTQGMDSISGQSAQDHPSGASAAGQYYTYTGQTCASEENGNGGFSSGSQMFTWTVGHSNLNTKTERGTEHGQFTLSNVSSLVAGFNGQITNYDFATPITDADSGDVSGNRVIYYASGHGYDASGSGSGAGNFNTHGGAATGNHFRGTYGTLVYQESNNSSSPCQTGSANYCFEAILLGQTN